MNSIGKILVVFVTATSLGFLAFVAAFRNGGPDWQGELRSPEVQRDFVFKTEPGDIPKYTLTHRRTETKVSDGKRILAEVVLDARKRLEQDINARSTELKGEPQRLEAEIKATNDSIVADRSGVETRAKDMNDYFQKLWDELESIGNEFSKVTIETQDVMKVAQERREEGLRLSNQLALLRTDQYAAEEQKKVLEDELVRLEVNKGRLERRHTQLRQQLNDNYDGR